MRKSNENNLKTYYARIFKRVRTDNRLSQESMADILDMNVRSYIDLEHDKNLCSCQTFHLLVLRFNLDANELIYSTAPFFTEE